MGIVYYQIITDSIGGESILEVCEASYWNEHYTFPDDETEPVINGINIDNEVLRLSEEYDLGLTLTSTRVYDIPSDMEEALLEALHNHSNLQFEECDLEFLQDGDDACEECWIDDYWNE